MVETEQRVIRIRVVRELAAAQDSIDPESLWLDLDVAPEEVIRLDPLDITGDMVDMAEQPELADFTMRNLRPRNFSLRALDRWLRTRRKGSGKRESPKDFVARLRGGGPRLGPHFLQCGPKDSFVNLWSWARFSGSGIGTPGNCSARLATPLGRPAENVRPLRTVRAPDWLTPTTARISLSCDGPTAPRTARRGQRLTTTSSMNCARCELYLVNKGAHLGLCTIGHALEPNGQRPSCTNLLKTNTTSEIESACMRMHSLPALLNGFGLDHPFS